MSDVTPEPEDALLELGASFDDLHAIVEARAVHAGDVHDATVRAVEGDTLVAEIDGQTARAPAVDFATAPAVGDTVRLYVEQVLADGLQCSHHKALRLDLFERLEALAAEGETIEGTVTAEMSGGWAVDIGLKAFLPRRQLDAPQGDLETMLGSTVTARVLRWDDRKNWFVLSTRAAQPAVEQEPVALDEIEEGEVRSGQVVRMADFGAFVDLGGVTGLLHINDLSWGRPNHPSEVVEVGDTVQVKVLKVDEKKQRVGLGLKQLQPHPWTKAAHAYPEGSKVSGKVISLTNYGAFVEVAPGIEGLVHVSELAWDRRVQHPKEVLTVGESVDAVVVLCDPEHQKLKLSVKRTLPSPWSRLREALPPGTRIEGPIRSITDFGLFVSIAEGIDGLVHRSDVSWERDDSPLTDRFRRGQKVEVMVLDIDDERERASLGMKQLQARPSPDAEPAAQQEPAPAEQAERQDAPEAAQRAAQAAPADPAPAAANPAQAPAADAPPATDPSPEG